MADVNKPKLQLQLRSGLSVNGDKSPSPATKLLINHGKPNFTIPRSHKTENGNTNPSSPTPVTAGSYQNNNNGEFVVKSTTFNGVFKPSNISPATKQTLPHNGNIVCSNANNGNEAAKVVLRRPRFVQAEMRQRADDENVPEFIRRQRRIQERLANQNILDFENRRSGYFTQVMISPSSPNRQSFVETMSSPAVKPGLEMPPPAGQQENAKIEATLKEQEVENPQQEQQEHHPQDEIENGEETASLGTITQNGEVEEEEVAKAIEEVNKAVEGEDDDRTEELEDRNKNSLQEEVEDDYAATVTACEVEAESESEKDDQQTEAKAAAEISTEQSGVSCASESAKEHQSQESSQKEATNVSVSVVANKVEESQSNGHTEEEPHDNGNFTAEEVSTGVTICHANGMNGPRIPTADPSGGKGVNYEAKTVVSFSQELGNGDNKYPDSVKVIKDNEGAAAADDELKELTKLKFEIKADNQGIEVKPVLVNEAA